MSCDITGSIPNCVNYGTGYNIKVDVISSQKKKLEDIDFHCRFYMLESNREICMNKAQMIQSFCDCRGAAYYALLYDKDLGNGWLMCDITIFDPEPSWPNGVRPVTLHYATGIYIGNANERPIVSPAHFGNCVSSTNFQNGYKVKFSKVDGLPATSYNYIFYGVIRDKLESMTDIKTCQAEHLQYSDEAPDRPIELNVTPGDKVVALIPMSMGYACRKDDGFGNKVMFDDSVLGANGTPFYLGDEQYRVYGEIMTVTGKIKIYIE